MRARLQTRKTTLLCPPVRVVPRGEGVSAAPSVAVGWRACRCCGRCVARSRCRGADARAVADTCEDGAALGAARRSAAGALALAYRCLRHAGTCGLLRAHGLAAAGDEAGGDPPRVRRLLPFPAAPRGRQNAHPPPSG